MKRTVFWAVFLAMGFIVTASPAGIIKMLVRHDHGVEGHIVVVLPNEATLGGTREPTRQQVTNTAGYYCLEIHDRAVWRAFTNALGACDLPTELPSITPYMAQDQNGNECVIINLRKAYTDMTNYGKILNTNVFVIAAP